MFLNTEIHLCKDRVYWPLSLDLQSEHGPAVIRIITIGSQIFSSLLDLVIVCSFMQVRSFLNQRYLFSIPSSRLSRIVKRQFSFYIEISFTILVKVVASLVYIFCKKIIVAQNILSINLANDTEFSIAIKRFELDTTRIAFSRKSCFAIVVRFFNMISLYIQIQ